MAAVAKLPEMRRQFRIMQRQLAALLGEIETSEDDETADRAA
jgi:hypothetical protein